MSDIAIRVKNLSKLYQIGVRRHNSLSERIHHGWMELFRRNECVDSNRDDREFWALKDVSFEIKHAEMIGIIGCNGAGKSTLLKVLSRITQPTQGRVEIYGRVGSLLEVGTGFHPELSGRDNIYLSGTILGMKKAEINRKFDEIVDFAETEKFLDTPVKRYSSGMYTRLAFAVAAHLHTDILIVDEVLAVGDVGFQKKCLGKMGKASTEGRTVIFVSHNLAAVKSLCGRSVLLANGRVQMDGPSDSVVAYYLAQQEVGKEELLARIGADSDYINGGEGFFLEARDGGRKVSLLCGDPISLEFVIEAPMQLSEMTVGIGILIRTDDNKVVTMSSKVQQVPSVIGLSRFWKVRCDMGRLPLNAGTYVARVHVGNGLRDVARFSRAFIVEIEPHDVFGWGNSLPGSEHWGPMYWSPEWDVSPF